MAMRESTADMKRTFRAEKKACTKGRRCGRARCALEYQAWGGGGSVAANPKDENDKQRNTQEGREPRENVKKRIGIGLGHWLALGNKRDDGVLKTPFCKSWDQKNGDNVGCNGEAGKGTGFGGKDVVFQVTLEHTSGR